MNDPFLFEQAVVQIIYDEVKKRGYKHKHFAEAAFKNLSLAKSGLDRKWTRIRRNEGRAPIEEVHLMALELGFQLSDIVARAERELKDNKGFVAKVKASMIEGRYEEGERRGRKPKEKAMA
jgi:hypothetical protein